MPLISVILPVFNAERTIGRAVQSILDQSWNELELIVVNDGSTDKTTEVLAQINDVRLHVLTTENRGVSAAANLGLKQCQGQLVARMDADDYSYPLRLEKQIQLLENKQLDVVGCQVRILNDRGQPVDSMQRYQDWINRETLDSEWILALRFVELPLVNPSILARRSYFELGYTNDQQVPEDYDLFLQAAELGFRFGKVAEVLLDWQESEAGLTRSMPRYSNEAFDRCRKKYLMGGPLKQNPTVDLWGAGPTGKSWMKWLQAKGVRVRHLIDVSPRRIGQRIHGCQVQEPESLGNCDETPLLIAVGSVGARDLIFPFLKERGFTAGLNAWFVA